MYRVTLKKSAEKELAKLPLSDVLKLRNLIRELAQNPYPAGHKKLRGFANQYRIRSGNYRIIYAIQKDFLVIEILKVGDRKDIYS